MYLAVIEALDTTPFDIRLHYPDIRRKNNHIKVVCYRDFRDRSTLLYAISIQKEILTIMDGP